MSASAAGWMDGQVLGFEFLVPGTTIRSDQIRERACGRLACFGK